MMCVISSPTQVFIQMSRRRVDVVMYEPHVTCRQDYPSNPAKWIDIVSPLRSPTGGTDMAQTLEVSLDDRDELSLLAWQYCIATPGPDAVIRTFMSPTGAKVT